MSLSSNSLSSWLCGSTQLFVRRSALAAAMLVLTSTAQAGPIEDLIDADDKRALQSYLKENPTDLGLVEDSGLLPLSYAAQQGELNLLKTLIKRGADVNAANPDGSTALQQAIVNGRIDNARWLIKQGVEITAVNAKGQTPLHWAAQQGDVSLCKWLLSKKMSPLQLDSEGQSALEIAIAYGQWQALNLLIEATADPVANADAINKGSESSQPSLDDDRIRYWSALYWAGQFEPLAKSLERDLLSGRAQSYAAYIWGKLQSRQDQLSQAYEQVSPELKTALGETPKVILTLEQSPLTALQQHPAKSFTSVSDVSVLVDLAHEAEEQKNYLAMYDYLERGISLAPNLWQFAWMYEEAPALARDDIKVRAHSFSQQPGIKESLTGQYIQALIKQPQWTRTDRLPHIDKFLERDPFDARALSAKAYALDAHAYFSQAADAALKATVLYPFYANRDKALALLIKNREADRAQRLSTGMARWFGLESVAPRGIRYFAEGMIDTGDRGAARRELKKGLELHPQDGRLWSAMARLETLDKRSEEAVFAAQKSVELLGDELTESHLKRLLTSYRDNGDTQSAVEAFFQYRTQLAKVSPELFNTLLDDLKSLKQDQEFGELLSQARTLYPLDLALGLKLVEQQWQQGQKAQALKQAKLWLPDHPSSDKLLTLVHDYTVKVEGSEAAHQWLVEARNKRPWMKKLWQLSESSLELNSQGKMDFWQKAVDAAPAESFACEEIIDLLVADKQWQQAYKQSESCLETMHNLADVRISARQQLWLNQGWIVERQSKRERISAEAIQAVEASFDQYLATYGNRRSVLRYREAFCVAKQDRRCAADALAQRSYYSRDSTSMFHDLVADYSDELGLEQTFGYGATMIERRPYDTRPVVSFVHKHLLWGGSPIVALKAIHEAQARGLNIEKSWERQARGKLGDSLSEFERYSLLNKYPGESKRYLDWFESARTSALEADGTQVFYRWDGDQPEVEILLPSGELISRRDHPRFGRPTYFSRGATYIRLEYTDNGKLQSIENSNGKRIELQYNREDEIRRLISDEVNILEFSYNAMSKPTRIEHVGHGILQVSYDDAGEIISVDSDQGHQMALHITQTFQKLLGMVNQVKKIRDLKNLPELDVSDPHLDSLRAVYQETPSSSEEEQLAALELGEYLVTHQGYGPDVFDEAEGMLFSVVEYAIQEDDSKKSRNRAARAVGLLYDLYREVRPQGLAEGSFTYWSDAYSWLRGASIEASTSVIAKALKKIDQQPLELLRDAHRLQRSDFSNSAYWKRYGNQELLGAELASAEKNQLLLRHNGDLALATNKGLAVMSDGFWQWYGYDRSTRRFSANIDLHDLGDRSQILSLAETNDGVLWLGTPKGLMAISGDYDGDIKTWGMSQGMLSTRVNALSAVASRVSIATPKGLLHGKYSSAQLRLTDKVKGHNIDQVIALPGDNDSVIYQSGRELFLVNGNQVSELTVAEKMAYRNDSQTLYWLSQGVIYEQSLIEQDGLWSEPESAPKVVAGQANLLMSKRIHELVIWPVEQGEQTLVVNTDTAINVLTGSYFEAMALPLEAGRGGLQVGPRVSVGNEQGVALISDDGVYTRLKSKVEHLASDGVYDLLSDDKLAVTYMAMGDHIRVLPHELPLEASEYFSTASASHLAQDSKGNLITHDDRTVLRFKRGTDRPQELFRAYPSVDEKGWRGEIVDILVDSRDDIWVAAGSSLYRYHGETVTEFNYILNSDEFPSRSPMLMSVYETLSGDIQVVASNESHLKYKGVDLEGGLLQWNGKGFDLLGKPDHWFATAYTAIDESTAVVSTNHDFAREMAGADASEKRQSYLDLKDPSYTALKEKASMVWLGGKGQRLGTDDDSRNSWLFPSAGGVLLYHNGRWIYPDRLNQLLPQDQALGQYGGRTVHAVEVDSRGRIYAATDVGLMVYQSHGVASLLTDNQLGQMAFSDRDFSQQQALSEIFLSSFPSDSQSGKLLQRYQQAQKTIDQLEHQLTQQSAQTVGLIAEAESGNSASIQTGKDGSDVPTTMTAAQKLQKQLKQKSRVREKLLARMETEHYGLYQMLKLDPREVAAMHKRLTAKQALLQFLPTPDKLLIQLVTQQGAQIREVSVSREDLETVTSLVVKGLRYRAAHLADDSVRGLSSKKDGASGYDPQRLNQHLAWLYEKLLRPVERELSNKTQVFVTPVGALTYLPFPALIRQSEPTLEYAAERFNIGVIPSMYHLSLVLQQNDSYSDGITMVADPDGSLPGARAEVARIAQTSNAAPTILQGGEATYQNLSNSVDEARILHLATHGTLDSTTPADSYLLLADNHRLNVIDIATLDLDQTDLVVLSACETGIGKPGLEYATLARAFALASVPTVVASYWKVDDGATANLMQAFYDGVQSDYEDDYLAAMSAAQRRLIQAGGLYAEPAAWAGFTVFGKP
ncbi:MAG: CHAT domain-containing protein [Cellvibrionaceae bacterium]